MCDDNDLARALMTAQLLSTDDEIGPRVERDTERADNPAPDQPQVPGRWHKGMASPNPSGRPKTPRTVKEVRELARQHTAGAIETLVRVHQNPKAPPAARVAAATALIDRGWGRAPSGDFEGATEALVIKVLRLSDHVDEMKTIEHDNGQADG
jgi:hypothetical protein